MTFIVLNCKEIDRNMYIELRGKFKRQFHFSDVEVKVEVFREHFIDTYV